MCTYFFLLDFTLTFPSIKSTFNLHICKSIVALSLVPHSLIHMLIQIITHTYVTLEPQVWKPANVWLPGKGKMCLFYAIKRKDRVGVRSLLASGEDANSRQGIEGCLPGPGEVGYGSEPDPVRIESAWCMAARDKRPIDVAIQSK